MGHQAWQSAEIKYDEKSFIAEFDHIKFKASNTSSIMVLNEIFIESEYECELGEEVTVIDIGMNVGAASLYFTAMENVKK